MASQRSSSGPPGRYAPNLTGGYDVNPLKHPDRVRIEAIFDCDISDDDWRTLNDIFSNFRIRPNAKIGLQDWKTRNTAQIRRAKDGLPFNDKQVIRLANAFQSGKADSDLEALELMNAQIRRDEEKARELKNDGRLYERDESGEPIHEFCWIDELHLQTEAIISAYLFFEKKGVQPRCRNPRGLTKSRERLQPLPFEEFCFRYILDFDFFGEDDGDQRFLNELQKINHVVSSRDRWNL